MLRLKLIHVSKRGYRWLHMNEVPCLSNAKNPTSMCMLLSKCMGVKLIYEFSISYLRHYSIIRNCRDCDVHVFCHYPLSSCDLSSYFLFGSISVNTIVLWFSINIGYGRHHLSIYLQCNIPIPWRIHLFIMRCLWCIAGTNLITQRHIKRGHPGLFPSIKHTLFHILISVWSCFATCKTMVIQKV